MKTTLFAAIMDGTATDSSKPDYSGDWKVNFERCDFNLMGLAAPYTLRIEPSCGLSPYWVNGIGMEGKATWDDDSLVVRSVSPNGNPIRHRMMLSPGGRTLTCFVSTGSGKIMCVLDKQWVVG